jgi:hypothetical protein
MNLFRFINVVLLLAVFCAGCGKQTDVSNAGSFAMTESAATPEISSTPAVNTKEQPATPTVQPTPIMSNNNDALLIKPAPSPDQAKPILSSKPEKPAPTLSAKQTATASTAPIKKNSPTTNEINWSQFFDNDAQNTPSNRFWDLNGKTVLIKGFMGEVLSFDKHWFLLIPSPGAECPFDNGDETYWNKIMIVYVPDDFKLRYTTGPLLITGRLDVGIKLDESGYKTMFRLYNASFEKIKE